MFASYAYSEMETRTTCLGSVTVTFFFTLLLLQLTCLGLYPRHMLSESGEIAL